MINKHISKSICKDRWRVRNDSNFGHHGTWKDEEHRTTHVHFLVLITICYITPQSPQCFLKSWNAKIHVNTEH